MNRRMLLVVLTLSALFFERSVSSAQTDELDRKLSELASRKHLPGFSVAVVSKDGVLFQKGYGYADIEKRIPYTPQSLQNIGSVSKTLIGVSLMQLVEQGKIKLDEDINHYLPFTVVNPYFPRDPITVRHLANHTSTLKDTDDYWENVYRVEDPAQLKERNLAKDKLLRANKPVPLGQFVKNIASEGGAWYSRTNFLKEKPGTRFQYSNLGADLAGYIVECVAVEDYAAYTEKNILKPLAMTHSGWSFDKLDTRFRASQYVSNLKMLPRYSLVVLPDGGLITSVEDLSKYLIEMIKGYEGESRLLQKQSFRAMMDRQSEFTAYGMFWTLDNGRIGHGGGDPGTSTYMFFDPTAQRGALLFTNYTPTDARSQQALSDVRNAVAGYAFTLQE